MIKKGKPTRTSAVVPAVHGALVAPFKTPSKKTATLEKAAPIGHSNAKVVQMKPARLKEATVEPSTASPRTPDQVRAPRASSKSAEVIEMVRCDNSETLADIMKATEWPPHKVRSFISNVLKRNRVKIVPMKNAAGEHAYRFIT